MVVEPEIRTVKRLVPMTKYGMDAYQPCFPDWYYRTMPMEEVTEYKTLDGWKEVKNGKHHENI